MPHENFHADLVKRHRFYLMLLISMIHLKRADVCERVAVLINDHVLWLKGISLLICLKFSLFERIVNILCMGDSLLVLLNGIIFSSAKK